MNEWVAFDDCDDFTCVCLLNYKIKIFLTFLTCEGLLAVNVDNVADPLNYLNPFYSRIRTQAIFL